MDPEKIHLYTDASFSKSLEIGVAGWLMFGKNEDHQLGRYYPESIRAVKIKEVNNIRVEIKEVILVL